MMGGPPRFLWHDLCCTCTKDQPLLRCAGVFKEILILPALVPEGDIPCPTCGNPGGGPCSLCLDAKKALGALPDRFDFVGYRTASFSKAKERWKAGKKWPVVPITNLFLRWWLVSGRRLGYDTLVPVPWSTSNKSGPVQIITAAHSRHRHLFRGVQLVPHAIARRSSAPIKDERRRDRFELARRTYEPGEQIVFVAGRSILLVDDVHTTGASACACTKILLEHGAKRVGAFAIAKNLHETARVDHEDPTDCPYYRRAGWAAE